MIGLTTMVVNGFNTLHETVNGQVSNEGFQPSSFSLMVTIDSLPETHHTSGVQPYQMVNCQKARICILIRPQAEEHQPSGTCNFSRIDNARMIFGAVATSNINVYAVNYNVLRVMSGMGGLACTQLNKLLKV